MFLEDSVRRSSGTGILEFTPEEVEYVSFIETSIGMDDRTSTLRYH